ncbi:ArsA family ATPase [Tomitella gaofuii]|uniref:ArsA family ATPase n=1 Tax=Tomitella gaofuii TaxID=2760083 RepID=UPI0015FC7B34|nr:ArsA family ATPase [Tomitella gaofuii]
MTGTVDVAALLADGTTRVVVCCGAGGVGKTTTAAALALRAAESGRSVVVLTIDPARRLAQALGVGDLSNTPQPVPLPDNASGGGLHAMMLDMRRTFDDMVVQYATPERAREILANPFYQTVASSFAGTQEYMAMEKLGQLVAEDAWDLIVVDTPPSRNALDFLDAPQRLGAFLDGRMIRMFMAPGRGIRKIVSGAVGMAMRAVSTVVGSSMLADASLFVQSFEEMFGGFRERANRTYQLLRRPGTAFLVVSAAEPDALREASFFVERLTDENMPLAGLVLNRTHPMLSPLPVEKALAAADRLDEERGAPEGEPRQPSLPPVAGAVLRIHAERGATAKREVRLLGRFTGAHPRVPVVGVPSLPFEVSSLDALRAVGDQLVADGS